jgi:aminoglycoside phosphotransferase family enzyme
MVSDFRRSIHPVRHEKLSIVIQGLLSAAAYPHAVGRIELLETHISWVVLTGEFAYKIKKPVELDFLDFGTLEKRRHYCEVELRLNKSWAPDLYLEVVPITQVGDVVRVGGDGTPVEYAVRMRQFEQSARLDHMIEQDRLSDDNVLELAEEIAHRHERARRVEPTPLLQATTERLIWDNFDALQGEVPDALLERLHAWLQGRIDTHVALMRERVETGFFRECHGDLHLANIVRLKEGMRAFDCIEFSRELREIDVVADYAFLTMDFIARGAIGYAYLFVNRYLEKTGDYDGARLLPMYVLYRAMVRAKVAVIGKEQHAARTDRAEDRHTIDRYCALARAFTSERRPVLVLMTGLSGSGKTWLSTRLVPALPALRLRSDLERRRMFGLDETADSQSGIDTGIYDAQADRDVYGRLLAMAEHLLCVGINVILDAAFLDVEDRRLARELARRCKVRCVMINAVADEQALERRVERRKAGGDISEAGIDVLRHQLATRDPLETDELAMTITVDTTEDVDAAALAARIREFRS